MKSCKTCNCRANCSVSACFNNIHDFCLTFVKPQWSYETTVILWDRSDLMRPQWSYGTAVILWDHSDLMGPQWSYETTVILWDRSDLMRPQWSYEATVILWDRSDLMRPQWSKFQLRDLQHRYLEKRYNGFKTLHYNTEHQTELFIRGSNKKRSYHSSRA